MVNHVETLLLNRTAGQLKAEGFVRGEPWYIDPAFVSPVAVPTGVRPVFDALFNGVDESDPVARPRRVLSAVSLAMQGEVRPFLDVLDKRRTVEYSRPKSVRGLYEMSVMSDSGFENDVVSSVLESSGLPAATGIVRVDGLIPTLYGLARSCREKVVRFGAVVALLAYQLEAARTGRRA